MTPGLWTEPAAATSPLTREDIERAAEQIRNQHGAPHGTRENPHLVSATRLRAAQEAGQTHILCHQCLTNVPISPKENP